MSLALQLFPEVIRTLAFSGMSGTYAGVGSALQFPTKILFVQNLTDTILMFSFNGVDDHFVLPSNGFLLLDVTTNKVATQGSFIKEGTRFYVREPSTAATSGAVYISSFFGRA